MGQVEHVETSAEVQQWLMEQEEGVSVTMCRCGQHHLPLPVRKAGEGNKVFVG